MALASVGLGWVLAGRVLRPIQDMTATARRLSDTNLHERPAGEITAAGLSVRRDLQPAVVDANRVLLERLAANLVQNAVLHNVASGWMEVVTVRTGDRGG